jgi:hypothetical protein
MSSFIEIGFLNALFATILFSSSCALGLPLRAGPWLAGAAPLLVAGLQDLSLAMGVVGCSILITLAMLRSLRFQIWAIIVMAGSWLWAFTALFARAWPAPVAGPSFPFIYYRLPDAAAFTIHPLPVVFAALAFPIGLAVGAFGTRSFRASQLVSFVCMAAIILWMAVTVKPWPESIDPTALRVGAAIGAIVSFCVGLQLGAITNGRLAADDMKRLRKLAFAETRGFYDRLSQASTGLA